MTDLDRQVRLTAFQWLDEQVALHGDVRTDILEEEDGPMLQHGLKALHRQRIILPRRRELWPDRALLDARYQRFRAR